ncbi:hypothetical protein VKT23_019145 [Stygiomarasmius scandens]|uniref:Uncharacterized protein n=1 Tax=Marasmiellus scandens TaxID=2682957 RepID=A0ABR1IM40_9AGAR
MEAITGLPELTELHLFSGSFEPDPGEYEFNRLTLDQAGTDDTTVDRERVTSPMRITRLVLEKLEHRFDLMKFFLDRRYFDLESLKDLSLVWMRVEDQIGIPTLDYRYLDRLLERVGPTLKCLKLGIFGGGRRPRDRYLEHFTTSPMTSPLQRLVALEVSVECKEPSFHGLSPSPHLALLRSLSTSFLTRVELALSLDVEDFPEVDEQYFIQPEENATQHWKAVDCLLADEMISCLPEPSYFDHTRIRIFSGLGSIGGI